MIENNTEVKNHLISQLNALKSEFNNIKDKKDYMEVDILEDIKNKLDREIKFYELKMLLVDKLFEELSKYDYVSIQEIEKEKIQISLLDSKWFVININNDCKISFGLHKACYYEFDSDKFLFFSNVHKRSWNLSYTNRFIDELVWNSLLEFEYALGCSKKENENLIFERPIDELFTLLNKDHYGLDKKSIYDCADIIRKGVKDLVNILFSNESWQRNIIPILDKYFEAMRKVTKGE